ncbi:MAG: winged helix-turn-helix domain-containing protein [Pirellulaceae bacterium]|nr:winged helix-turn-helix domain-containing protein [Pirellulaceae bacterium]
MKKAEVQIGAQYWANVSGKRCEVRIDGEKPRGGWDATNLATGKRIVIKSAQRLQDEPRRRGRQAKVTTEGNVRIVENEPATVQTIGGETSGAVGVLKKPRKTKTAVFEAGEKKLSCMTAALKVLVESAEPMNAKEMVDAMEAKGYWTSPGGKTPHATLYSAILRELARGDESRFVKTERGRFVAR